MKDNWQDQRRIPARPEPRRDYAWHGGSFRERGSDEERRGRRGDRRYNGEWFADALRRSDRGGGDPYGLSGRDLAHRIEELGSFDPYENVPPFRDRSGQEGWPGGRRTHYEVGSFRGKGPRGYKRPDARIAEDVNDRLTEDPWLDASDIEVSVSSGEVTLGGFVSSRKDKWQAEDCAEAVSGVSYVQNNIRVRRAGVS
ncbi:MULTISPECIES: BON domain-containing protein [Sinorhizobium]|uniref:BON domain-containing protein n=1 Tax=Sinorhizobium americanum TaxID=194963 RepID=A0A2S3YV47_9HYPH|nr:MULTISPECIES: BON domain-containing protein [Sinorhizobium]PDT39577.1 BON domain-containing protein [Sinorhizobium sp. FG01]POH35504.1 BON domain-containing protein [Sinorhizobium americanum]